jgi:uncharacterized protein (TIGR03435 family)
MMKYLGNFVLASAASLSFALAQTPPFQPSFEVASVRPSGLRPSGPLPIGGKWSGGPGTADPERIEYSRVPLQTIILNAFDLPIDQVAGPDWIVSELFDINAKVPVGSTKEQAGLMLQNLLRERFHMTYHHQTKEFPSYDLVVAGTGLKLKQTTVDPTTLGSPPQSYRIKAGANGFPDLPTGVRQGVLRQSGTTRARFRDYSSQEFTQWLRPRLGTLMPGPIPDSTITAPARITDETGLTGKYDFTLEYAGAGMAAEVLPQELRDKVEESGVPSIFTAVEKQLGLKLERTKTKAEVLVIDHIDKVPTAN